MTHSRTTHRPTSPGWLQRIGYWLSHPKSEVLPPIFGDAVPPDLKVFQASVDAARNEIQEVPAPPAVHGRRSKPARRK